ncbi:MAG: hypothetical protein V2A58_18060 [Planctomycetota bacterium]
MRIAFVFAAVTAAMVLSHGSWGEEAPVAWEESFDNSQGPELGQSYYEDRGSGKTGKDVVVREASGGVFRYGLKYDPARKQDRLNLMFGDCVWGPAKQTGWGPFDLTHFPLVEIRWRGTPFTFYYGLETAGGKRIGTYAFLPVVRKDTDADGREWNVSIFRGAPDSSVPTQATAVKLLGINLALYSPDREDTVTEIDSIRVRGFTVEEAREEASVIRTLKDFPQGRWRGFDDFFPWGVYVGYLRRDFESWNGDYEGAYGSSVRHHFNYVPSNDEVEIGRFGGQSNEEGLESYIAEMKKLIEAAKATGIRLGADVRRMMDGRDEKQGYEQLLPIARRVAEAFADDDVIVSWKIADEPGLSQLVSLVSIIRAIREADPLKRPELIEFNATAKFASYAAYLDLNCFDNYPVLEGSRNPWAIRTLAREYRKLLPDKPMWVVLQSFETRPPAPKGSYIRPSDAEIRLMAYLAIAEGAKGILWYSEWTGMGRDEGLVERAGQPRGGMLDTLSQLGERLIPIGKQLLSTEALEDTSINVTQEGKAEGRGVALSVLKDRTKPLNFLLAVNEDLEHARSAKATLPEAVLAGKQGLYDLYTLDGENLAHGQSFAIAALAGGDGRIYAACDEATFQHLKAGILCAQAEETVRALTPDLTIATRWGVDVAAVHASIDAMKIAAQAQAAEESCEAAARAKTLLAEAMEKDSELNGCARALADVRVELAEVSRIMEHYSLKPRWWTGRDHPMLVPNPGFLDLSRRYFEVGRGYRDAFAAYLKGQRDGLWEKVHRTRMDCLSMREAALTFLREKLAPAQEPEG